MRSFFSQQYVLCVIIPLFCSVSLLACSSDEPKTAVSNKRKHVGSIDFDALDRELNAVLQRDFADETTSDLHVKVEKGLVTLLGTVRSERYRDYLGQRMQQEMLLFLKPRPGIEESVMFRNEITLQADWDKLPAERYEDDEIE